ncbi:MAG: ROK family protein, partial [Arenicellales bacterium]
IDGRLHSGLHHIAGEWGHNVLESYGPPCYCGKRGCIETLLSGPGFLADYRRLGGAEATDPEQIVRLARDREPTATAALSNLLDRFGQALAQVINIVDPHTIVLGGGLSNIDELYEQGPAHIAKYVFNSELKTPIKRNRNGDSAGVLGAARLWDN